MSSLAILVGSIVVANVAAVVVVIYAVRGAGILPERRARRKAG